MLGVWIGLEQLALKAVPFAACSDHRTIVTFAVTQPVRVRRTMPMTTPRAMLVRLIDHHACGEGCPSKGLLHVSSSDSGTTATARDEAQSTESG